MARPSAIRCPSSQSFTTDSCEAWSPGGPQGIERTKGYILARELEGIREARTLAEILDMLEVIRANLEALDIFEVVGIKVEKGDQVLQHALHPTLGLLDTC